MPRSTRVRTSLILGSSHSPGPAPQIRCPTYIRYRSYLQDGLWAFAGVAPNSASVHTMPAVQRGTGQLRDKRHPRSIRGLYVLVAVAGLMLVQPLVPATRRKEHNDVAGFIYAVLGVAYAVMLGLMIIAVWESFAEAETRSTRKPPSWPRSPGSPIGCPNPRVLTSRSWPALSPRLW